jgi:hypothetical protein
MKKALIAMLLCVGFVGCVKVHAQDARPDYNTVSEACNSGKKLSYTIVQQRDAGAPLKDMLDTITGTPVDPDDSMDGAALAKSMAVDTTKDAFANPKLGRDAIAYRAYDRCMKHFGYSGMM